MIKDGVEITQKAALGSQTTQIAVQYNGITPEAASQMAINLFMDNFPKLQDIAKRITEERVEHLCKGIMDKLISNGLQDFSAFADPDVQYILLEAQKNYARLGTQDMLSTLTSLVAQRVQSDGDFIYKVSLDKAISIVNQLEPKHLDFLSLLFVTRYVKLPNIHTSQDLISELNHYCDTFCDAKQASQSYLEMLGCTQISLVLDIAGMFSKVYSLDKKDLEKKYPTVLDIIIGDYGLTPAGIILGAINAEAKTKLKFDIKSWII